MLKLRAWALGWGRALASVSIAWAVPASAPAVSPAVSPVASTDAGAPPALGLIVKLKDTAARPLALGTGPTPGSQKTVEGDPGQRLGRLLADLRITPRAVRANGRAAQHLDFGRVLPGDEAERLAQQLRARPEVEWVVPNVREKRLQVIEPNDALFAAMGGSTGQWWLHTTAGSSANDVRDRRRGVPGLQTAWALNRGLVNAPVIAVLDTGITDHPELNGRVLPGHDFVSEVEHAADGDGRDSDPSDPGDSLSTAEVNTPRFRSCGVSNSSWHGTVIAGMLAAQTDNLVGVAGVQWDGRVLPVRVAGKCGAAVSDIVDGMRWAAGLPVAGAPANPNPARILNISFGGSAACNAAYQDTINELAALGVVVVAAAGNEHGGVSRPASCAGVVGVAALNRDGFKSTYSNFGPQLVIATVGGDPVNGGAWGAFGPLDSLSLADEGLLTLSNTGTQGPDQPSYAHVSGTSFSVPIVAGVMGLMLSVDPSLSAEQLHAGLRASARPHVTSTLMAVCSNDNPGRCLCTTATCGVGILDATEALRYAAGPSSYQAPNWPAVSIDSVELEAAVATGPDLPANVPAAAPAPTGGGGGAMGVVWLLLLALAILLVKRNGQRR